MTNQELVAEVEGCGIRRGVVVRHYKGGYYVITSVGLLERTLTPIVGYRPVQPVDDVDFDWFRPWEDFNASVLHDGGYVRRFTIVERP